MQVYSYNLLQEACFSIFLKDFLSFFTVGSPYNSICMYYAYVYMENLFEKQQHGDGKF